MDYKKLNINYCRGDVMNKDPLFTFGEMSSVGTPLKSFFNKLPCDLVIPLPTFILRAQKHSLEKVFVKLHSLQL